MLGFLKRFSIVRHASRVRSDIEPLLGPLGPMLLDAICNDPYLTGYFWTRVGQLAIRYSGKPSSANIEVHSQISTLALKELLGSDGTEKLLTAVGINESDSQYALGSERSGRVLSYIWGADFLNDPDLQAALAQHDRAKAHWRRQALDAFARQNTIVRQRVAVAGGLEELYWCDRLEQAPEYQQAVYERHRAVEQEWSSKIRQTRGA